jgi:uncharacterized protein (UPF0332 family)
MKPETVEYVRYRMSRAEETLGLAKLALEHDYLYDVVNRLYYACFFAVSALLLVEDLSSSKHKGIQSLFSKHWINSGRFPAEMGRFFHRLYEHRQKSDYADLVAFEAADVKVWFEEATGFIERISEEIEKLLDAGQE